MKWQLKSKAPSAFFKQFPEYSPLIIQLLYSRGLKTQPQIDEFFNPDYQEDFHSPLLLKGMEKAVKRILQAIAKQEKVVIYGDFDADGVCSMAILFLTLKALGLSNPGAYIPDRRKEGHGLNESAVKKLAQKGTKLIITVDCASRDLKEVDLAKSLGLEIIITDHHELGKKLPKAVALINPLQKGDKYPFKNLAGAGVAYKLASALIEKSNSLKLNSLKKWLLDLAAIATVADVMPIIGENRTLVKYGLRVLTQTKWLGLQELMKSAQLKAPFTNINTYTLGYILGPRLNAAGRINQASTAFRLLITQDKQEAERLAQQLNQENSTRQNLTEKVVRDIKNRLEKKMPQGKGPKLIFEGSADYSVGIIGLAAGKIAEKYCRPTIIYREEKEMIDASCRTIPQFNLIEAIEQCADFLDDFGGHKAAAGFSFKKTKLDKVKEILSQIAEEKLKGKDLTPLLDIDVELSLEDINWSNYEQIQNFAPFGKANPEPRFLVKDLEISNLRMVGNNGKHLKMELMMFSDQSSRGKTFKAIAFNFGEWQEKLKKGDSIDVVFELIADEWDGYKNLQMKIIDLRPKNL